MVMLGHLNADRRNMKLTNTELKTIIAGATVSSSLINSILRGINIFMDVGRYLGSSIRRLISKEICSF